ncbi:MAG: serine hydrolase domain-containing protein [Pseudomonadota bacterium]
MQRLRGLMLGLFSFAASLAANAGPVDQDRLNERLTELADSSGIVGLAVAVVEDGEITFARGYGVTEIGGSAVTADTVFRWASLSKGVASSMVAQLASEDQISLSDTVAKFNTSLRLPAGGHTRATLENILSHMIGIVPNAYDTTLEDGRDPATIRTSLGKLNAVCPVGDCHTYQNVAFDTVTEVVEAASGRSYSDMVETYIFEPLGMGQASLGRERLQASLSWARPHRRRSPQSRPQLRSVKDPYYNVPAAGGVNGSIRDLALFMRAQMGLAPDVFDADTLTDLHTPRVYTRREQSGMSRRYGGHLRDARYALGWRVYKYGEAGHRVVGHRGAVEGYRSLILFDPARDSGVVALWNSNVRQPVGIQFEVMDMVYDLPQKDWLGLDADG